MKSLVALIRFHEVLNFSNNSRPHSCSEMKHIFAVEDHTSPSPVFRSTSTLFKGLVVRHQVVASRLLASCKAAYRCDFFGIDQPFKQHTQVGRYMTNFGASDIFDQYIGETFTFDISWPHNLVVKIQMNVLQCRANNLHTIPVIHMSSWIW